MIERVEWERRFKERIVTRCMQPLNEQERANAVALNPDFTPWTREEAEDMAGNEFAAVYFGDLLEGFEDDPEGSADECMSYWEP